MFLSHIPWPMTKHSTSFAKSSMPLFQGTNSKAIRTKSPWQTLRTKLLAHPCFSNPNSKHLSSNCCKTLHHDNVHVIVHQILIPSSYYAINTHPIRSSLIIFVFDSLWVFPFLNCHTRFVTFCLEPPHIKTSLSLDLVINTQVDIQLSRTNWSTDLQVS